MVINAARSIAQPLYAIRRKQSMKNIITDIKTLLVAIVGLIGGGLWAYSSDWEYEPMILIIISLIEIIGYFFVKRDNIEEKKVEIKSTQKVINKGVVEKQINIQDNSGKIEM